MNGPGRNAARRSRRGMRGATSLLAVMFLLTTIAALLATVLTMTSSDIIDSSVQSDSVQALLLADSGIERAAYVFKTPANGCDNAGVGAGPTQYALGAGTFTINSGVALDFANVPLVANRCRVQATGRVGTGVARTVDAIVERNGNTLPPGSNTNFNAPLGTCVSPCTQPTGWYLEAIVPSGQTSFTPFDDVDPAPGTPTDRTAYARKSWNGPQSATGAGNYTFSPPIMVNAGTTMQVTFDLWVNGGSASKEAYYTFSLSDGVQTWSSAQGDAPHTGAWTSRTVTIAITGTGTKSITQIAFQLELRAGQPKQAWLDNIVLQGAGGSGATRVIAWREPVN